MSTQAYPYVTSKVFYKYAFNLSFQMNNVTSSPGLQGTLPLYSSPANLGVQSMATVPGVAVYSTPIQHGAAGGAVTCADRSDFSTFPSSIGNGKNLLCS